MGLFIRPDCADLPYFLRAYFAFKMGLPFGYSKCTRGGGGEPPKCYAWWNIQNEEPRRPAEPAAPCRRQIVAARRPLDMFGQPGAIRRRAAGTCGEPSDLRRGRPGSRRLRPLRAPDRRRRRPFRIRTNACDRRQHRLLSGAADPGHAASGDRLRRSVRAHPGARASACRRPTARPASSSPSTRSPTARSRASASGAATSCSRTIPRSAAPASSASGRSSRQERRLAAADQRRDRQESAVRRFLARPVEARRSKRSTIAWTT